MEPIEIQSDSPPVARVYFSATETPYPGWYVQRYVGPDLITARLSVVEGADAYEAVESATKFLNCSLEQIQVEGHEWRRQAGSSGRR